MRFEEAYEGWNVRRLTQAEAALLLGVCEWSFLRNLSRYEADGLEGLLDRRLGQASNRRAPVDEVMVRAERYRSPYSGWNVKHFHSWYRREGSTRTYTWVKKHLQNAELVPKAAKRGAHRKRRERRPLPGMMIHQDGSAHEWVSGALWVLIVTMDDATSEHHAMFFVEEEGTASSFRGIREVIVARGLFSSFYSDRGSYYWHTPEAGGKVDKQNLTQFGRVMKQLGIEMIAAYSPEARGRSERAFATHQGRLPQELALAGITDMAAANRYLQEVYLPAFNSEFAQPALEEGTPSYPGSAAAWMTFCANRLNTRWADNCVRFERLTLQIPVDRDRCHYVKTKVRVHRYANGHLAKISRAAQTGRPQRRRESPHHELETGRLNRPSGAPLWAETDTGLRPTPISAHNRQSRQFMCYRTGQV